MLWTVGSVHCVNVCSQTFNDGIQKFPLKAQADLLVFAGIHKEYTLRIGRQIHLIKNRKTYIIVFLRLIAIPCAIGAVLLPFGNPVLTQSAVLLFAMPCGLNTIVFPKLVDENCEIGASLAFVSNILACFTIPLVCALFQIR